MALPNKPLQVPGFFVSTNAAREYFETNDQPIQIKVAQNKSENYCFIMADPFSGMDTTDLYCFVRRGEGWVLFLTAGLWKTPPDLPLEFKADGDFMDVIRNGNVVLKINPPK